MALERGIHSTSVCSQIFVYDGFENPGFIVVFHRDAIPKRFAKTCRIC